MARPERRLFLEELARLLAESGWLTLSRLVAGDMSYAWNYGFQFHGTWFWYQPTFDSDWEKFSPGFCLLSKLIEQAAENPATHTIDLGLGAEDYKDRFANRTRETLYVTVESSGLAFLREVLRYRASAMVRKFPRLEAGLRGIAGRLQRVREHLSQQGVGETLRWLGRRLAHPLWSNSEVFFYEWCGAPSADLGGMNLLALDLNRLAEATAQYSDDPPTLGYLLRCAQRLRAGGTEGWALIDGQGSFLHFAWTTAFDDFFLSELNSKVKAPTPNAVMIFDCWTPTSVRGRGYYERVIELIASRSQAKGGVPWIFSASTNSSSIRGVEKAGFQRRYSMVRQRILGLQRIKGEPPARKEAQAA